MERSILRPQDQSGAYKVIDQEADFDQKLWYRLIHANDHTVCNLLNRDIPKANPRSLSVEFGILTASFCSAESDYFDSEVVFQRLLKIMNSLHDAQRSNGTIDAGGNKQSPPDTGFLIDNLGPAAKVLAKRNSKESQRLINRLDEFLKQAGEALLTGGVHTPNHRWVISSALAHLYQIYGDIRYKERINEWLSEGIFVDEDGQYSERSRIYSKVVDQALITIATILNRPDLLEPVRKNLQVTFFLMENNGDLVTLDSRRQDQNMSISQTEYYFSYRFMATRFNNPFFASVVQRIENDSLFEEHVLSGSLIHFLDVPELLEKLPASDKLPNEYVRFFPSTNLARIKREQLTATLFGGNDFPLVIASGRSSNPSFFTFRKGEAILEYARMSTSFFNTGYFRSEGLQQDGNTYRLHELKKAYYYQPLPADKRNLKGDYKLSESPDGRYWSKMDFKNRPTSNVEVLKSDITITENNGEFEMNILISGVKGVEVTLEFCFRSGGQLSNVRESNPGGNDFLFGEGYASYQFGKDTIQIGPGITEHQNIERIDGEQYSTHFGSIKGKGVHLFLTGRTPFSHTITLK